MLKRNPLYTGITRSKQLVDCIPCQTEELLAKLEDSEEAYDLLKAKA